MFRCRSSTAAGHARIPLQLFLQFNPSVPLIWHGRHGMTAHLTSSTVRPYQAAHCTVTALTRGRETLLKQVPIELHLALSRLSSHPILRSAFSIRPL